jgi:hypothetical protein
MPKLPLRSALRCHWQPEPELGFPWPLFALLIPALAYLFVH